MTYATIQPPFTLKFDQMSKKELKDYFVWFLDVLPHRLEQLSSCVKNSSGFENWQMDFSPHSLERLGEWLAGQVEVRSRTESEINELVDFSVTQMAVPEETLTNRSFSLAIDVGMYLSRVFLMSHDTLKWEQTFGSKKSINYGQPILTGFGVVPFNPVRMIVTLSFGIASGRKRGSDLRHLYDFWSSKAGVSCSRQQ